MKWEIVQTLLGEQFTCDMLVVLDACDLGFDGWAENVGEMNGRRLEVLTAAGKGKMSPAAGDPKSFTPKFLEELERAIETKHSITVGALRDRLIIRGDLAVEPNYMGSSGDNQTPIRLARQRKPTCIGATLGPVDSIVDASPIDSKAGPGRPDLVEQDVPVFDHQSKESDSQRTADNISNTETVEQGVYAQTEAGKTEASGSGQQPRVSPTASTAPTIGASASHQDSCNSGAGESPMLPGKEDREPNSQESVAPGDETRRNAPSMVPGEPSPRQRLRIRALDIVRAGRERIKARGRRYRDAWL